MATPPTRVSYTASAFNDASSPRAVNGIAVQNGDLVIAFSLEENAQGTAVTTAPSGTGLTFTQLASVGTANSSIGRTIAWSAPVTSSTTLNFSFVSPNTDVGTWWGCGVAVYRAHSGVGAVASASSGSNTQAITTTADNSGLFAISVDWNGIDGTTRTRRTVNSSTGSEDTYFRDAAHATWYAQNYSDAGTAGSKTVGYSAPTGQLSSIIAIEIKGVAGGTDYTAGPADSIGVTDAVTATQDFSRALADSVGTTDAITATQGFNRTLSDSVGLTDSITVVKGNVVNLADSVGVTDSLTVVQSLDRALTDTVGLTDSITVTLDSGSPPSMVNFPSDSGAGLTPTGSYNDTGPLNLGTAFGLSSAATISGVRLYAPNATTWTAQLWQDGVKVAEKTGVSAAGGGWSTATFDTPYTGNTSSLYIVSALFNTGVTSSYAARTNTFSDGTNPVLVTASPAFSNTTDNGMYTYGTTIPATPSGTSGTWYGVDAVIGTPSGTDYTANPADPIGLTDAITLSQGYVRSLADSIGITDAATFVKGGQLSFTANDSIGITDTGSEQAMNTVVDLADAVGITDAGSFVLTNASMKSFTNADVVGITDAIATALTIARSGADTVGITDGATFTMTRTRSVSDSVGIVDSATFIKTIIVKHKFFGLLSPSDFGS